MAHSRGVWFDGRITDSIRVKWVSLDRLNGLSLIIPNYTKQMINYKHSQRGL